MLQCVELPYRDDSSGYYAALRDLPWPLWFDSADRGAATARYDILVAAPLTTLVCDHDGCRWQVPGAVAGPLLRDDPLQLLKQRMGGPLPPLPGIPFTGGAAGWFSYDLGHTLLQLPPHPHPATLPQVAIGIYDWALISDHQQRRCQLLSRHTDPTTAAQWPQLVARLRRAASAPLPAPQPLQPRSLWQAHWARSDYLAAFDRVQRYLHDGDCYQVNLAHAFTIAVQGDPWHAYLRLRRDNPAPFAAYLDTPYGQILSASPERFLQVSASGVVETKPIKGTCRRGRDAAEDAALAQALAQSPKDRAENVMIVDLLRNDLGRVCRTGSVTVPSLFAVESFATLFHLVSTIRGELAAGTDALDLLRGAFPGGSITGAPKRRTMAIIAELEPLSRGIYCGTIAHLGWDGAMDSNIVIRTLVHQAGQLQCHAGGGIVIDSDGEAEYQETLLKSAALRRLLEPSEF